MKKRYTSLTLLSIFLMLILPSYSQTVDKNPEKELTRIMQSFKAVGLAVAVVKNGEMVYQHAFGLKNIEKSIPLANEDIFRIASISKSFSATAIMQLVEAGKLSLDDDFSDLIGFKIRNPKFPDTKITLRMILSHTSSISDREGYFNLDVIQPDKNPNWKNCYNDYEPGTDYEYCNLNFNMVGTVIEKISGERFDRYIKAHILDPLGLYGGYCVDSLDAGRFATIYEYDGTIGQYKASPAAYAPRSEEIQHYIMGESTPIFSPTGGMKISASDLAKYMTMHMNQGVYHHTRIISTQSAQQMQTPVAKEAGYGLAIGTTKDRIPGEIMKGHTGSAYGLYSFMFFQPEKKFGIVAITNGCTAPESGDFDDFLQAVMRALYEHFIK